MALRERRDSPPAGEQPQRVEKQRADKPGRQRVAHLVEEGVYLAAAATRLSLKNRILVETLAGGEVFDVDRFVPDARTTLLSLAAEADADAERAKREQDIARGRFSDPLGTHDYRSRDIGNLRRRRRLSRRTAKALRERADDLDALRALVEAARDAAWEELAANIDRTLRIEAARPDLEEDYASMREARMDALRMIDLQRLSVAQRRRQRRDRDEAVVEAE